MRMRDEMRMRESTRMRDEMQMRESTRMRDEMQMRGISADEGNQCG